MIPPAANRPTVPSTASTGWSSNTRYATCCGGRPARALRGRGPSHQRLLPPDVHRHFLGGHRDHSPLRTALQNRTHVQAGGAADRLVQLPFLDVRHEAAAPPQRQPAPPSRVARIPRRVRRKLHAYHVFIQAAVVCQGLLQYLAVAFPQRVWHAFGSWLRTIRPGIPPSELVVANALRQSMPEFLLNAATANIFAKFVSERQDTDKMQAFRLAS